MAEFKLINKNKKVLFDYEILETYEAGVELLGAEVKAARAMRVNLKDSFVRIMKGEAFLFNAHFSLNVQANAYFRPNERRIRKLLLHKRQIDKLFGDTSIKGLTIAPLSMYFNHKNIVKIQIALVRGKKLHDKRESLKKKALELEAKQDFKNKLSKIL